MKKTKSTIQQNESERIFVKYSTLNNSGVESVKLTRNAIGYVIRGEKCIHDGDNVRVVSQGEIFFLPHGTHYIENIPNRDEPFEQIIFYYLPSQMQQIIVKMSVENDQLNIKSDTSAPRAIVSESPSRILRNLLLATSRHYELGGFRHNTLSENIHLMQIAHSILAYESETLRAALLGSLDTSRAEFERVIYDNLFIDKSVEELAIECSRSLTSFKKEFKQIFGMPPHQWYMYQRLVCAKLMLRTTSKSISQIGNDSAFPNTSHFIKLFKRHFGTTPASYRARLYRGESIAE